MAWRTNREGNKFRCPGPDCQYEKDPRYPEIVLWFQRVLASIRVGGFWVVPMYHAVVEKIDGKTFVVREGVVDDQFRFYFDKAGYFLIDSTGESEQ